MPDKSKILEWIKEAETTGITLPAEIPKRIYDEKLVAWLDILGMREEIRLSDDAEEIFMVMKKLQNYVEDSCEPLYAKGLLNYLQISDGFIVIADLSCINELCNILCQIQWQVLVYSQRLLRGALTAGKVSMTEDSRLIIGPAFIEAFAMESENAIFPRILFASEIKQYISDEHLTFQYIKEDSDHFFYLDFLKCAIEKEEYSSRDLNHLMQTQGVKRVIKESYEKHIHSKKSIAQKYGWLIAKLRENKVKII